MALKTMPIAKLQELAKRVETAIAEKVTERRRELESALSKLIGFEGARGGRKVGSGGARGSVAPKYRNPENAAENDRGARSIQFHGIGSRQAALAAFKCSVFLLRSRMRLNRFDARLFPALWACRRQHTRFAAQEHLLQHFLAARHRRQVPTPWRVVEMAGCFTVQDATGQNVRQ
jgi:hypothetical protein